VTDFGDYLAGLIEVLFVEMRRAKGVGLSANQIGSPLAVCVVEVDGERAEFVNPQITDGFEPKKMSEGCLSIPGYYDKVERWTRVEGTAQDRKGNQFTFAAEGSFAHVIQHEVDHLNGMLYIDRLDPARQSAFWRHWWGDES